MSDSGLSRRQPPSPLVFSTDSALSSANPLSSNANTVSMPFVRRHVTRRLKAAKAECDKELQRVTNSITTFFEEKLREADDIDGGYRDRGRGRDREYDQDRHVDLGYFYPQPDFVPSQTDGYYSDGGYEAEVEYGHHSRHRTLPLFLPLSPV